MRGPLQTRTDSVNVTCSTESSHHSSTQDTSILTLQREMLLMATDYMIEDVLDGLSEYIRLAPTPDVPCWSGGWDWGDLVKKQAGVRKGLRPFKERLSKGTVRPTLTYIELGMQRASTTVPETPIPHEAIQWIYTAIADTPGWQTLFDTGGDYYVELCASIRKNPGIAAKGHRGDPVAAVLAMTLPPVAIEVVMELTGLSR